MRNLLYILAIGLWFGVTPVAAQPDAAGTATESGVTLGEEYSEYNQYGHESRSSGKSATDDDDRSWAMAIALYIPNRVLDLIDIVRADVGVGLSAGVVVRATSYGQIGYRQMMPASLRLGFLGRDWPFLVESSSEIGVGPLFLESKDRDITPLEFGAGVDLGIAGAYLGVSLDEAVDFVLGIVGIDFKEDDL